MHGDCLQVKQQRARGPLHRCHVRKTPERLFDYASEPPRSQLRAAERGSMDRCRQVLLFPPLPKSKSSKGGRYPSCAVVGSRVYQSLGCRKAAGQLGAALDPLSWRSSTRRHLQAIGLDGLDQTPLRLSHRGCAVDDHKSRHGVRRRNRRLCARRGAQKRNKYAKLRLFLEIFDLEPGRRCQTAGQSRVLAGSKLDDGKGKAVFACRRRTRPRGDEVGMAGRRPSCGQEPVRSGPQLERRRLTSASIPVTVHSAATGISSICSCRITPDRESKSPTHGACSRAALVCE
jgi:hypothetical protein